MSQPIKIWGFYPESDASRTRNIRTALRKKIEQKKWQLQERVAKSIRTPGGGKLLIADPRDVIAAYRDAHRSGVAVLTLGEIRFCSEPPEERAIRRNLTLRLQRFCQYKAFCGNLPETEQQIDAFMDDFSQWLGIVNCDGDPDPRILPFPVFKMKEQIDNLGAAEHRATFEALHHARRGRDDAIGFRWDIDPQAFHGHETLTVAGKPLTTGFHWDVQNDDRRPAKLGAPNELWEVHKYVNIYPDGKIIGRHPFARKLAIKK